MYNLGMKNIVKNKVKDVLEKYKCNLLLTLIIFILFLVCGYSKTNTNYKLYINDVQVNLVYELKAKDTEQYIHIDDLTEIFGKYVYDDKISGKVIITTYNKLTKINKSDVNYTIKDAGNVYFNLNKIADILGMRVITTNGKIYILDNETLDGVITKNRTELWDNIDNNVIDFLSKDFKVKVVINKSLLDESERKAYVQVTKGENIYYGWVLKQNIQYEYFEKNEQVIHKKVVLVKADNQLTSSADAKKIDMVAINMYRLSGVNTLTKLQYTNNVPSEIKVLATINNGQKSANYDADIVTNMLNSQSNREKIIEQIISGIKDLAGVNLDFSNFKASDKNNYTQFIKELAAVLHENNKMLTINVPSTKYIDIEQIIKFADYVILQPYFVRTLSSKTSGPISSVKYVEEYVQQIATSGIDVNKLVLELPAYTILWTERQGTVINAEQYNMQTMQEYLTSNNIKSKLDNASGQNYINYTKGITTYKMWLEDEYSMIQKTQIASKYNLAGVSIYKNGMEEKNIYNSILKHMKNI